MNRSENKYEFDTSLPKINKNIVAALKNDNKTVCIMNDGRIVVFYNEDENWFLNNNYEQTTIYTSHDNYNNNKWHYRGDVDPHTYKPLGYGETLTSDGLSYQYCYHWENGDKFEGSIDANTMLQRCIPQFNGDGKCTTAYYLYIGEFKNGMSNGYGQQYWFDGVFYEGTWLNGYYNGHGTYICNEYTYDGDFVNDLSEGFGKITWANGNSYQGKFLSDNICLNYKHGIFTFADGSVFTGSLSKIWGILIDPREHK
uniref:MORN repeat protein n=1 Tax=viral metagenome TaxID=1070528 RepID=A0A6C0DUR9_9ZZZZ